MYKSIYFLTYLLSMLLITLFPLVIYCRPR